MADTFSLRFEIDASTAEAGAKKFVSAINAVNKSLDGLDAKAEKAFAKLMAGGSSGGAFTKLAKDLSKLNNIKIDSGVSKSINNLGTSFQNLKSPSSATLKNITTFATTVPALINGFNISNNFSDSLNKISGALATFKVPSSAKIDSLKYFGETLQSVSPLLKVSGNFGGITKLGEALGNFRAPSEKAVSNMKAFFSALNNSGAKASVNSSLVSGITKLSDSLVGFKSPSAVNVANLKAFFNVVSTLKSVSGVSSIAKLNEAFAGFKGPTQAQTKNVKSFVDMLSTLKVPTNAGQIASYLERIGISAGTANKSLSGFRTSLNSLGTSKINSEAKGLTTNLRGLENAFSGTFQAASVFRTLIGTITLGTLSSALYDANNNFNAFKSTMLAVNSGDLKQTGDDMRYVEGMADKLGQRISDVKESYGGFAVSSKLAGVATDDTRKVFEATVTAMTVLHRSSDRTKLALLALEQMMSKGKVSSEELRRQLGEQMPGAVNLMAKALGVSTAELDKMLKKGEVISSDALPKFAAEIQKTYGPALENALSNSIAQFNLLSNAVNAVFIVAGQSGVMSALAKAFGEVSNALKAPEFLSFASDFGERTATVIEKLGTVVAIVIKNIDSFVLGLKVLLALNIARFLQSFTSMIIGGIASGTAWITNLTLLKTAITGVTVASTGATVAVTAFSRIGAAITALTSGPIGAVLIGLGALAAAWYASKDSADTFTTVIDSSKDALDRYRESLDRLSTSQLVTQQQKLQEELEGIKKKASEAKTEFQGMLNVSSMGQQSDELSNLQNKLSNMSAYIKDTGITYNQFVKDITTTKYNTFEATELANAFLKLQNVLAVTGAESLTASQKIQYIQDALNGINGNGAAAEMAKVANAAASMGDIVASAAAKVVDARYKMSLSEAQSTFSKEYVSLYKDRAKQLDAIAKSEGSLSDKRLLAEDVNNDYAKSYQQLNQSAEEMLAINKKMTAKSNVRSLVEKYGDAADESKSKIISLQKQIKELQDYSGNDLDPTAKSNTLAVLQKQLAEAQKPKKTSGGGGGAASNLDATGQAVAKYRKEQEALEKMVSKGIITQDMYNDAMDKLRNKYSDSSTASKALEADFNSLKNELIPSSDAAAKMARDLETLNAAKAAGIVQGAQYEDMLTRIQKKYAEVGSGSGTWVEGIKKGFLDLTKTSDDFVNDVAGAVTNTFNNLTDALTSWVTTGKFDFSSFATSIISDIAKIVIQYSVVQPIIKSLSSSFGSSSSSSGGGFFSSLIGSLFGSAKGNVFSSGNVVPFAKGGLTNGSNNGIVSTPTLFNMTGTKTGLMGEAGPEAIMPIKRMANGDLGIQASAAAQAASTNVSVQPQVNVSVTNNGGNSEASVSSKQNSDGSLDINVLLEKITSKVASDISKGGTSLNKAFESRYGTNASAGNKR